MVARKKPPLLRYAPLSKSVVIVTRYTGTPESIVASEKWDVPQEDFFLVLKQFEGDWTITRPGARGANYVALLAFTKNLIRIVSETHPDNTFAVALNEIID